MTCLDDSSLPFLHGTLVIRVEEAKDLPDMDRLVGWLVVEFLNIHYYSVLGGTAARMSRMLL